MCYGMLHCQYSKQKLNEKSYTGAELVETSEYVPFTVCIVMFMESQVYDIKNIFHF